MKTKVNALMLSALLAAGTVLTASMQAQPAPAGEPGGNSPAKERGERPKQPEPGERLEKMREHLGLTDDQVAKLKPIFASEIEEMKAKRKELGKDATREERRAAMEAMREKYQTQVDAVLTAEQKAKVAKMRERRPGGPGGPEGREHGKKDQE
jgi:Spy/CpxP family protein refolding chaperone